MNPSTEVATAVLDTLVEAGVEHVVLCPGSRSAPLAFAAYTAPVCLHTRIDERSAAFLALGLAKGSGRPVAIITTSGTATANLHPAVLEAHHAGVGLIVLTADRPAALRGTNANQTTDQVGLYGSAAPCADVAAGEVDTARSAVVAALAEPGPYQVNLQFAEPLLPEDGWLRSRRGRKESPSTPLPSSRPAGVSIRPSASASGDSTTGSGSIPLSASASGDSTTLPADRVLPVRNERAVYRAALGRRVAPRHEARIETPTGYETPRISPTDHPAASEESGLPPLTVVVAGDDAGPVARRLAQANGWPVLAEPSSGSRAGPNAIRTYRLLLDGPVWERIEAVVVYGHPTLSRPITRLISRDDIPVYAVPGPLGPTDPGRVARPLPEDPHCANPDPDWLRRWQERDREVGAAIDAYLAGVPDLTPYEVAATVAAAVPRGGLLFVGASNPARDLDLMMTPFPVGERRMVMSNRGLAGIDGTVSSAIGAALGRPGSTRSVALVGDVTFLHDGNGLQLGPDEVRPDLTIVVVNDDGGSIFASLEQGDPRYAADYDKLFGTPHGVDLAALCRAHGVRHRQVRDRTELVAALAQPATKIEVVEAVVRRDNRRSLDAAVRELAHHAEGAR
ncbi:MAG: thiamine pyrophosphate-binding protein [Nocardioidaceae bacterium]